MKLLLALLLTYSSVQAVEVYSHRGTRSFSPENTMPAYKTTLAIGTDWVDMDIVLSKDKEVVVSHDPILSPNITRLRSGSYITPEPSKYTALNLTVAELKKFDVGRLNKDSNYAKFFPDQVAVDGTEMPTLREVIKFVKDKTKGKVGFQIEMKTDPTLGEASADPKAFAEALFKVLKEENVIEKSEIQAFDFRCLFELQKLSKKVKTAYLTSRDNEKDGADDFYQQDPAKAGLWTGGKLVKDYGGSIPKMVKALGGYAWEPEDFELTEATLKEAKALGLKVVVWSWPEKLGTAFSAEMVEKMINWGVDGIITDDTGRLISMLAARGMKVPARY